MKITDIKHKKLQVLIRAGLIIKTKCDIPSKEPTKRERSQALLDGVDLVKQIGNKIFMRGTRRVVGYITTQGKTMLLPEYVEDKKEAEVIESSGVTLDHSGKDGDVFDRIEGYCFKDEESEKRAQKWLVNVVLSEENQELVNYAKERGLHLEVEVLNEEEEEVRYTVYIDE